MLRRLFEFETRYGRGLSMLQRLHLQIRRALARPTRWDRAARDWRRRHPGLIERIETGTLTLANLPTFTAPAPFVTPEIPAGMRVGVACHLFYEELFEEMAGRLAAIPGPFRLVVTTDSEAKRATLQPLLARLERARAEVRVVPNRGRDIAPKIVGCADLHRDCDVVLHIHGKRARGTLAGWREHLLDRLLGDRATVATILRVLAEHPDVGLVAASDFGAARQIRFGQNAVFFAVLAEAMGRPIDPTRDWLQHPNGSMFWARTAALAPILDLGLSFEDFGEELRQYNGTLAHGVERAYGLAAGLAGYRLAVVARAGDPDAPPAAADPGALGAQVAAAA